MASSRRQSPSLSSRSKWRSSSTDLLSSHSNATTISSGSLGRECTSTTRRTQAPRHSTREATPSLQLGGARRRSTARMSTFGSFRTRGALTGVTRALPSSGEGSTRALVSHGVWCRSRSRRPPFARTCNACTARSSRTARANVRQGTPGPSATCVRLQRTNVALMARSTLVPACASVCAQATRGEFTARTPSSSTGTRVVWVSKQTTPSPGTTILMSSQSQLAPMSACSMRERRRHGTLTTGTSSGTWCTTSGRMCVAVTKRASTAPLKARM
mmetsp:Transcript_16698/g.40796  ORF Transcript_16698/g.40796 Transcript_16698/m.40796 type:complete len:272 (-) Transcript_16698:1306-2121(-)